MIEAGYSSDGHYLVHVSERCQDPIRVYCHDMESGVPREFITLESGADNNFAVIFHERLQDRFSCSGPARTEMYAERGATNFTKVRLDVHAMKVIGNDFTFSQSGDGKDVAYGTAGDCYSVNLGKCRKGSFKVDLRGTRLRVRNHVTWSFQGFPMALQIQDFNRSDGGAVVSAKCGGWCGRCKPTNGAIFVHPLCSIPAGLCSYNFIVNNDTQLCCCVERAICYNVLVKKCVTPCKNCIQRRVVTLGVNRFTS